MIDNFFNENCFDTINNMIVNQIKVNIVLTSPPYNTSRKSSKDGYMQRYENHIDILTDEEYINNTIKLFTELDKVIEKNGVILYNMSYSTDKPILLFSTMMGVCDNTNFTIVDTIIWKKKNAIPDNRSSNRMTRITEFVFVLARKNEIKTFQCNKDITSLSTTGIYTYTPFSNFIDAKNNDENTSLNKATFSVDFCDELLNRYAKKGDIIYDPYMGTGTTALSAKKNRCFFIGSEISKKQIEHSKKRLKKFHMKYKECEFRPPLVNFCTKRKEIFENIKNIIPTNINNFYEINFSNSGFIFSSFMEKKFNIKKYILVDSNQDFISFYKTIRNCNINDEILFLYDLWYLTNELAFEIYNEFKDRIINEIINNNNINNICDNFLQKRLKIILNKKKYKNLDILSFKNEIFDLLLYDIKKIHCKNCEMEKIEKLIYNSFIVHILGLYYYNIYDLYINEKNTCTKSSYFFILNSLRSRTDRFIFGGIHFINRQFTCRHKMMVSYDVKRIFNQYYTSLNYHYNSRYFLQDLSNIDNNDFILCTCNSNEKEKYLTTLNEKKCKWILYVLNTNEICNNFTIIG